MFMDEFEGRVDYDKWMKAVHEDLELMKMMDGFFPKWDAVIVPGFKKKGELWTEVEKLKVAFK